MFYWTAKNNGTYLIKHRSAKSILSAKKDAKSYIDRELGEGIATIYKISLLSGEKVLPPLESMWMGEFSYRLRPIMTLRKDISTGFKWEVCDVI